MDFDKDEEISKVIAKIKSIMNEQEVLMEKERIFFDKLENDIVRIYNILAYLKNKTTELELRIAKLEGD